MQTTECELTGQTPYSQSAPLQSQKDKGELPRDHEERVWKERMHIDADGHAFVPPMALKNCLAECAKYLSETVPGKGKATYTKHFEAGVLVTTPLPLMVPNGKGWRAAGSDDAEGEWLFLPSDGVRGSGKRVWKCYPRFVKWRTTAQIHVMDRVITKEKLAEYLESAGEFIGLGRFRPRNNGFYGKFKVTKFGEAKP
ncbi:MAG TPA: hypothetical protein VNA25_04875 [Phycisphaerae bacterium]|nr:hypothetical protein [Phycisphaerae bacterium]